MNLYSTEKVATSEVETEINLKTKPSVLVTASREDLQNGEHKTVDTEKSDIVKETIEVQSMCMNCEKEGINKILRINIPYFKNTLIHSFECPHCYFRNNIVQDLNKIKDKGVKITFRLTNENHYDRQLIKSEYGVIKIPEIDFEIPKETQKGTINNIEGFLQIAVQSLTAYLENLKSMYVAEETSTDITESLKEEEEKEEDKKEQEHQSSSQQITVEKYMQLIENTVNKLSEYVTTKKTPLVIEVIDPSGLSSLEHYDKDIADGTVQIEHYERSKEEINELGFYEEDFTERIDTHVKSSENVKIENSSITNSNETNICNTENDNAPSANDTTNFQFIKKYLHTNPEDKSVTYKTMQYEDTKMIESFVSNCPCCNYLGSNNFCEITIPGFKKCLILSYVCNNCNYKTSEVKSSGEINPKGKIITLTVKSKQDLNRFVIKSETASVQIPKVELVSDYGTLGGLLTTVEGLLQKIVESLEDRFKFLLGDSSEGVNVSNANIPDIFISTDENTKNEDDKKNKEETSINVEKIKELLKNLNKLFQSEELFPFDLIIDDLASNSYISSDDVGQDENLKIEEYDRTFEQNEMLGINSMKTENY